MSGGRRRSSPLPSVDSLLWSRLALQVGLLFVFASRLTLDVTWDRTFYEIAIGVLGVALALGGVVDAFVAHHFDKRVRLRLHNEAYKASYFEREVDRLKRSNAGAWQR